MSALQLYQDICIKLSALRQSPALQLDAQTLMGEMDTLYAQLTPEEQAEADAFYRARTAASLPAESKLAIESLFDDVYGDPAWCLSQAIESPRWPGGSPQAEDEALRRSFEWDLRGWAEHFFPDLCAKAFSSMHEDFFARHKERHGERGWRDCTAAPRGNGKTTVKGKLEIIHDILYQHERYIIICSANADLARDKVKDIRDALMDNIELRRVYGPMETREWSMADFVTANDCRVRAFTPKTKVRGFNWKGRRPSKILLDDAEDPEAMLTQLRRDRMSTWFWNDVMKLGNGETNVDVIGTILHPESLLSELLKNPGFRPVKYQAVLSFSDTQESWELWRQWRDIVVDLSNQHRLSDAHTFYEQHVDAMNTGAQVLWPEHEDYYALMLGRVIEGESSFWQERMNEPLADERYIFDLEHAAYCRVLPDGILRADGTKIPFVSLSNLCAYWDSTPPKKELQGHDYASCAVGFQDEYGYIYIVDAYLEQEISTQNQIEAIVDLLWRWHVPVIGMEANGYQSLLGKDLRESITKRALDEGESWNIDILPIVNSRNKMMRIRSLEPMVANGWLQFGTSLPHEAYRQFAEFIPVDGAGFDDFPDSVEGLVRVLKGLWNRNSY